jgi:hypothetical protein
MKRTIVSLVVGLGGVGVFTYELLQVVKIGTCASGNTTFVIASPCPSGTGTKILLVALGIMLATAGMLIGLGRTSLLIWSALFLASGLAMLLNALLGHNVSSGAKSTGYLLAATLIPMGAPALVWLIANGAGSLLQRRRVRIRYDSATATGSRS